MRVELFEQSSRSNAQRRALCEDEAVGSDRTDDYFRFGFDYFDNPHLQIGYHGYRYDGRYATSALRIMEHYGLKSGDRILEIGCAKGFVLVEFLKLGCVVAGLDRSAYAVEECHEAVGGKVLLGDAVHLPFEDDTFDLVLGKEILPHISEDSVKAAVRECMRVSKGRSFFVIQTGETALELEYLRRWDGTHSTIWSSKRWDKMFLELGFTGDIQYKVLVPE